MVDSHAIQRYPENASWAMKRIVDFIDAYAKRNNLENKEIKILDWGCGKGHDALWLLSKGYNVFGVDIDKERIDGGNVLLEQGGYGEKRLSMLDHNKTEFNGSEFDIIYSKQVLEHVKDIGSVAEEMKRLLSESGQCFHIFPAHRHINERHLFMPFVHWLPKNGIRKLVISAYTYCGVEPKWETIKNLSNREKSEHYYEYSVKHTYYRSFQNIKNIFEKSGLMVRFNVLEHPKLQENKFTKLLISNRLTRKISEYLLLTFVSIEVIASAGGAS